MSDIANLDHLINDEIDALEVRLISDEGEQLGIMSAEAAQKIADEREMDLVLISPNAAHTVDTEDIQSKCAWSPFEGHTFHWDITHTWINGHAVYADGTFDESVMGERMEFN